MNEEIEDLILSIAEEMKKPLPDYAPTMTFEEAKKYFAFSVTMKI